MKSRRPKGRAPATFGSSRPPTSLILFDIDGTLVLTGGAGGRAMSFAFHDVFGVRDALSGITMAGRTDAWIIADALLANNIPSDPAALARFREAYLRHLDVELDKPAAGKGLMPGVRELLDVLYRRDDVYLALLTGNYEEGARIKLEYFDLWRYFPCGAFGDDAPQRNGLVQKALARIEARGGPSFAAEDAVVIGDTPLDVACAAFSGARSVAVATGSHSVDELRAAGADDVMRDLADTAAVLRVLRIQD